MRQYGSARGFLELETGQLLPASERLQQVREQIATLRPTDQPPAGFAVDLAEAVALSRRGNIAEIRPVWERILAHVQARFEEEGDAMNAYLGAATVLAEATTELQARGMFQDAIRVYQEFVDLPDQLAQQEFAAARKRAEALSFLGALRFNSGDRETSFADLLKAEQFAGRWHEQNPQDQATVTLRWRCAVRAVHFLRQGKRPEAKELHERVQKLRPRADVLTYPGEDLLGVLALFFDGLENYQAGKPLSHERTLLAVSRAEAAVAEKPTFDNVTDFYLGTWILALTYDLQGDSASAQIWYDRNEQLRKAPPGGLAPRITPEFIERMKSAVQGLRETEQSSGRLVMELARVIPVAKGSSSSDDLLARARILAQVSQKQDLPPVLRRAMIQAALTLIESAELCGPIKAAIDKEVELAPLRSERRFQALVQRQNSPPPKPKPSP